MDYTPKQLKRRQDIAAAVIARMTAADFPGLSVRSVCALADISTGTFYHHFVDLDDFKRQILCLIDDYIDGHIVPRLVSPSQAENLRTYFAGMAAFTVRIHGLTGYTISSIPLSLPATPEDRTQERQRPVYRVLEDLLVRGERSGEFTLALGPKGTTELLIKIYRGYSYDWQRRGQSYDLIAAVTQAADFCIRALRAGPPTGPERGEAPCSPNGA